MRQVCKSIDNGCEPKMWEAIVTNYFPYFSIKMLRFDHSDVSDDFIYSQFEKVMSLFSIIQISLSENGTSQQIQIGEKGFCFPTLSVACIVCVFFLFSFYKKGGIVKLFFYSYFSMCLLVTIIMFAKNCHIELAGQSLNFACLYVFLSMKIFRQSFSCGCIYRQKFFRRLVDEMHFSMNQ